MSTLKAEKKIKISKWFENYHFSQKFYMKRKKLIPTTEQQLKAKHTTYDKSRQKFHN